MFAAKFSDPAVTAYPTVTQHHLPALNVISVAPDKVCAILKSIPANKACGPDGISARIVQECASELSVPLAKLCHISLRQGVFPAKWKQANIVPLHKKGDKKDPQNYRSVSLLSLFGKVLEKVVYDELLRHAAPVLSSAQHGFLPGRSCITNLTTYLHSAWGSISDGCQTDAIYTDFSSAFQSVNHKLLLFKLSRSYSIGGKIFDWFVSYLSEREQRVIVNGKTSEWAKVKSGVPEGALLAPLLFSLFINDLPTVVSSKCVMYADDVKIYRQISSPSDCEILQKDLTNVCKWSADWRLTLNPQKCVSFTITLKRAPILSTYHINSSPPTACRRSSRPGDRTGHKTNLFGSHQQYYVKSEQSPRTAHSIISNRTPQTKTESKSFDGCVLRKCQIHFRIWECCVVWRSQNTSQALGENPAQVLAVASGPGRGRGQTC